MIELQKAVNSGGGLTLLNSSHNSSNWVPMLELGGSGGGMTGQLLPATVTVAGMVLGAPNDGANMSYNGLSVGVLVGASGDRVARPAGARLPSLFRMPLGWLG